MKYKSLTAPAAMMFLLFFLLGGSLFSQVRPHHIFDNNMVLQRDQPVKIWGWANPSERVKIEFGGQVKSTQANQQGEWFTHLDPMKANTNPQNMKISG
jgi:sialate O-acetylesterase